MKVRRLWRSDCSELGERSSQPIHTSVAGYIVGHNELLVDVMKYSDLLSTKQVSDTAENITKNGAEVKRSTLVAGLHLTSEQHHLFALIVVAAVHFMCY